MPWSGVCRWCVWCTKTCIPHLALICPGELQVLVTKEVAEEIGGLKDLVSTGTSVLIEGHLVATPPGTKQVRQLDFSSCLPSPQPIAGASRATWTLIPRDSTSVSPSSP